ncbi:hypothetical protein EYS14_23760 [Alteromonadaceae bacterium M269]|nr:hypothetical protein EYS14_23760 [Alteromonadaceae bacterium M269]
MSFEDLCVQSSLITDPRYYRGMLSIHDAGETIRRIGLTAGLIPIPEFRVTTPKQKRVIDWVWITPSKQVVAAFEIDGINCAKVTYEKATESLGAIDCELKYLVLYQVRKFELLTPKRFLLAQKRKLDAEGIECVLDYAFPVSVKSSLAIYNGG